MASVINVFDEEVAHQINDAKLKQDRIKTIENEKLKTNNLSTGTYIINLKTTDGATITKKVLVK